MLACRFCMQSHFTSLAYGRMLNFSDLCFHMPVCLTLCWNGLIGSCVRAAFGACDVIRARRLLCLVVCGSAAGVRRGEVRGERLTPPPASRLCLRRPALLCAADPTAATAARRAPLRSADARHPSVAPAAPRLRARPRPRPRPPP